jgi:hypothetical protein
LEIERTQGVQTQTGEDHPELPLIEVSSNVAEGWEADIGSCYSIRRPDYLIFVTPESNFG